MKIKPILPVWETELADAAATAGDEAVDLPVRDVVGWSCPIATLFHTQQQRMQDNLHWNFFKK